MTDNGKLRREMKIKLNVKGENTYEIVDTEGNVLVNADEDFFIYLKFVNFKDGYIEGRYLGELTDWFLSDSDKDVYYKDGQFWLNEERVRTARMVAIKNKERTAIVIETE